MDNLKEILKSILFVAGDGVQFSDIAEKLEIDIDEVKKQFKEMEKESKENNEGIQVIIYNNKAQLCSNPNFSEQVSTVLNPIREKALTKAVMDVCAIVAYRQPITRLEIEKIRGFNSDYAVSTLIENNLIEVVGRKDAVGKPLLFGTTDNFLKKFGLESLDDLPEYESLLDRIKVIKESVNNNSLYDFRSIPENEPKEENADSDIPNMEEDKIDTEKALDELEDDIINDIVNSNRRMDDIIGKDFDSVDTDNSY